jgi:hypothetical protein
MFYFTCYILLVTIVIFYGTALGFCKEVGRGRGYGDFEVKTGGGRFGVRYSPIYWRKKGALAASSLSGLGKGIPITAVNVV